MEQHDNKVAFISGANRGIGFETAKKLGELGITVILGVRDTAKGQAAAQQLKAQGINAEVVHYDAAVPATAHEVYAFIERKFGKLDILINNAGMIKEHLLGVNNSTSISQETL